jgi:hypothetical protein
MAINNKLLDLRFQNLARKENINIYTYSARRNITNANITGLVTLGTVEGSSDKLNIHIICFKNNIFLNIKWNNINNINKLQD